MIAMAAFFFPIEDFEGENEPARLVEAFDTLRPFAYLAGTVALVLAVAYMFRRTRPTSWWARRKRKVTS